MITTPIEKNEQFRLNALHSYNILDTLEEADYDFLTGMASQICNTSISLVSLIDDKRQWFKSHHGLEIRETPKEIAFCTHAIQSGNDIFIVPDAPNDVLFQDNPLVTGAPHIAFYAGVPLVTSDGFALGTLCAIDSNPKTLTSGQQQSLIMLAKQVVNVLELRRAKSEIVQKQHTLENFFNNNMNLMAILNTDGELLQVNKRWHELLRYTNEEIIGQPISYFICPEDKQSTLHFFSLLSPQKPAVQFTNRLRTRGNSYKMYDWHLQLSNNVIYVTARDISDEAKEKQLFNDLAARNSAIMAALNKNSIVGISTVNGKITYANPVFASVSGYTEAELFGKTYKLLNSGYHTAAFWQQMWSTILASKSWRAEVCNKAKNGKLFWVDMVVHPAMGTNNAISHFISISHDITERKEAEQELEKTKIQLEQAGEIAQIGSWEYDILTDEISWSPLTKIIHEVSADYEPQFDKAISFYKEGESRDKILRAVDAAINENLPYDLECQIITANNNERWVRALGRAKFLDGKCVKLFGTFQNIDDQVNTRFEVLNQKRKIENIIEGTNVGTWEWNVQTGETVFNERWAQIVGYTIEELQPVSINTWLKLAHPDDLEESSNKLSACFEKRAEYYEMEARMKHKDGHWVWVYDRGKVFNWTDDGKPLLMYGTHQDISEKKAFEDQIKKDNLLMETILNTIDVGIVACDENGKLTVFNKATKNWHGLPPEPVPTDQLASYYSLYHADGKTPLATGDIPLIKALNGEEVNQMEMVISPTGKPAHLVTNNGALLVDEKGNKMGAMVAMHDVTAIREAETKLRQSEEAFRGSFEFAGIGMALVGVNGSWLKVNRALCQMLGYKNEELLKLTFQDITHPDDLETDLGLLQQIFDNKIDHYNMEKRYFHKNGQLVYIILNVSVVRNSNGSIKHFISQITNITDRKKATDLLSESLNRIQAIVDASTEVSLIETDLNGTILMFNKGAENLLGYKADEVELKLKGEHIHLPSEVEQRYQQACSAAGKQIPLVDIFIYSDDGRQKNGREWTYVRKDGATIPVWLTVTEIKKDGIVTGYLGFAANISPIKKAEEELKTVVQLSQSQNKKLKNFAYIVSHNLRSHSNNLSALLDYLLNEQPDLNQNEIMQMIMNASVNLHETIQSLSEVAMLSKTDTDGFVQIDVYETIHKAISSCNALAKNNNVTIINNVSPHTFMDGIPAYLDSIVLNFITNGIKYKREQPNCFLQIDAEATADELIVTFTDNGKGIDLKKYGDKLFEIYNTFHGNDDARGIGLFITKNQIELMGGDITVDSSPGVGTTFKVIFRKTSPTHENQ